MTPKAPGQKSKCEPSAAILKASGWTLVNLAKPQQDMRFGVPTIGDTTIENVHKTKAGVLAIEAARTILLDQPEDFITG
jgi:UDP-2,3-diacylglucosamine hydrolase